MELENITFVLVHDAWHGAWAWDSVIEFIEQRGSRAVALDLPGHGKLYQPENSAAEYSLTKYAAAVENFVRAQKSREVVLVGHGTAGPVLQLVAEAMPDEIAALVFVGAYILDNGETIAGRMPPEMAEVFQQLADSRADKRVPMHLLADYWRFNVMSDDIRRAEQVLARLNPEPVAPLFEPIVLKQTHLTVPRGYVSFNEDMSLPPGEFHPRMAGKLGPHRHMTVNAGHEGPLTKPREVAEALLFLGTHGLK